MVKEGDIVVYTIQGNVHNAIVLFTHANLPEHLGKNGEPLVHLAFIAPERESAIAKARLGYLPEVFVEHDVHHFSHEFSEQYKRDNGLFYPAQIQSHRGAGEWREVASDLESLAAAHAEISDLRVVNERLMAERNHSVPMDLPSAEDLDAVADEQKAEEATAAPETSDTKEN